MKQKRCQRGLLLLLGCLMLTGCGEAPYELTEEEQQLIVSYSAHVVSKFNRYQKDGLTYVPNAGEDSSDEDMLTPETEQPEVNTENENIVNGEDSITTEVETPSEPATLNSVYSDLGLTITYLGNEVTASYMTDDTYAVNAGIGKNLLVLKIKVENLTEEAVTLDNLSANDTFSAKYVMESGKLYNAKSVLTLAMNDFTSYEGTIEPQEAMEMILVFEIPAETTAVDAVELKVQRDGKFFQINL